MARGAGLVSSNLAVPKGTVMIGIADDDDIFAGAAIRGDGDTGSWDDSRVGVMRIEIPNRVYWFIPVIKWHENGNDFWIVINRFGFVGKGAAGTRGGTGREVFTVKQAKSAEKRLIEYYSGPEEKKVFPFRTHSANFLGVSFDDGWILVKK